MDVMFASRLKTANQGRSRFLNSRRMRVFKLMIAATHSPWSFALLCAVARMATLDFRISSRCMFFISWSRVTSNQPCLLQNLITSESGTFRSGWPVSSRNHSGNR